MRGIPGPPHSHPPSPGRGQQRWRRLRQGDPPPRLPRPHPRPLPAGRFADRPNRQKLRARGPLGAFLLWCELPMAGAGAGAETLAQPNQPGRRARSPGREAERRAGGHRKRPQPQLSHASGLCGQWPGRGRGRRRGGAWRASRRLRPSQDPGDQLSRSTQSARKRPVCPGGAGGWPALPAQGPPLLRTAGEPGEVGAGPPTGGILSPATARAHEPPPRECHASVCISCLCLLCTNVSI